MGGGGIAYGVRHAIIQLTAVAILAANPRAVGLFLSRGPRFLVVLVTATIALPLLQIVPLPPALWQELPGRDLVAKTFALAGVAPSAWFPLSLDPQRTLLAFCSTLVPAAMIVIGWQLSPDHRRRLALTATAAAALAFALGVVQLTSANTFGVLQDIDAGRDIFYATFSNRNSTGMFFLLALLLVIALPLPRRPIEFAVAGVFGSLFLIAVILTQSRTSMALLMIPIGFLVLRLIAARLKPSVSVASPSGHARLAMGAGAAVLAFALAGSLLGGGRVADSVGRFSQIDRDRLEIWEDGAYVTGVYWPVGSGTGTFDEVFQVYESLEFISPARSGRAHNDYVELAIESGAVGYVLLLGWLIWLGPACWQRRSQPDRWLGYAAWAGTICLALQSAMDYPLRNEALLCFAGLLVVLLLPPREGART
ncbi:hypothetical protein GRI99_01790 [Altererythrobacter buctensis]|uniref:O-antigen ligase-related domain-containing protein n=1 Tax=Alteraurantiacibacter buctensis TaxID=1503981 RepID=A0A844YX97_9SPHN|nr:hypothetical protein [Alteraurantiacibacter buctensis]